MKHIDVDEPVFNSLKADKEKFEELLKLKISWNEFFENFIIPVSVKTIQNNLNKYASGELK